MEDNFSINIVREKPKTQPTYFSYKCVSPSRVTIGNAGKTLEEATQNIIKTLKNQKLANLTLTSKQNKTIPIESELSELQLKEIKEAIVNKYPEMNITIEYNNFYNL